MPEVEAAAASRSASASPLSRVGDEASTPSGSHSARSRAHSSRESTVASMCATRLKNGTPPMPLRCSVGSLRPPAEPLVPSWKRTPQRCSSSSALPLYVARRCRYARIAARSPGSADGSSSSATAAASALLSAMENAEPAEPIDSELAGGMSLTWLSGSNPTAPFVVRRP